MSEVARCGRSLDVTYLQDACQIYESAECLLYPPPLNFTSVTPAVLYDTSSIRVGFDGGMCLAVRCQVYTILETLYPRGNEIRGVRLHCHFLAMSSYTPIVPSKFGLRGLSRCGERCIAIPQSPSIRSRHWPGRSVKVVHQPARHKDRRCLRVVLHRGTGRAEGKPSGVNCC